jgi:hypothetical protein
MSLAACLAIPVRLITRRSATNVNGYAELTVSSMPFPKSAIRILASEATSYG